MEYKFYYVNDIELAFLISSSLQVIKKGNDGVDFVVLSGNPLLMVEFAVCYGIIISKRKNQ